MHIQATFTRPQGLKNHDAKVHEGKKPYNCQFCLVKFGHISNLNVSIRSVMEFPLRQFKIKGALIDTPRLRKNFRI